MILNFWDLENYPPKKVYGFPSRDDLERYLFIRKARKSLTGELINTKIAGRDYQIRSIRAVMEAIEKRKRTFLLVMATGTGKTRICIALVDALMRAGWAERVLFLVDRIALRDQTLDAFKEYLPNEPRWPKSGEKEIATDRRIYVSTYPTMLNIIRDEQNSLSPHFFDLVVVDESHRSIYNTYQEILDYFNTITLGLTATPTDVIDHNTFQLFECEDGVQRFEDENFWNHLSGDKLDFLRTVVKPLFRTVADADYKAMRFEKDIVEVSLAHLANEKDKYETLRDSIIEEIGELPLSVNIVAKETELIKKARTNHFWATITEEKFDELILKIAPLMKFREAVIPLVPAKFNFKDIVSKKEFIEFGPQHEALSVAKYRELVEQKINALVSNNPILQKLKQGMVITNEEAEQLAEELHNEHPHITIDLLRKVYDNRKAELLQFIIHILGIEQLELFAVTVTKAFDDFESSHSYLTSRQLQFLDLLKNFVLEKGEVSKRNLIESPFTMIHPEGIRGIFNSKEINEILSLTQKVLAA